MACEGYIALPFPSEPSERRLGEIGRDRALHASTAVPTRERFIPAAEHRERRLADRSYHGWVSCARLASEGIATESCPFSIHERSAREKISTDQVAHVLNDEVSRKYIQSVKRCDGFDLTRKPLLC